MTFWIILIVVVVLLGVFALYLGMTAGRIDRLHRRIDTAELSLDAHLLRRSGAVVEIAASGLLDPASSFILTQAAHSARTSTDLSVKQRDLAESDLTDALNATIDSDVIEFLREAPGGSELIAELLSATRRVELSRRFLNDAVRACVQLRQQRSTRWFHLAGHTPWPQMRDIHDAMILHSDSAT